MNHLIEVGQRVKLLSHSEFASDEQYNPVGILGIVTGKCDEWVNVQWPNREDLGWDGLNSYRQSDNDLEVINE